MKGYKICECPIIGDDSQLSFFEFGKEIDFLIKRVYYIYHLNPEQTRGFHAHKNLKQVIFSPYGSVTISLDDGIQKKEILLDSPHKLLIIEKCLWREFTALLPSSVLCVGASEVYSEDDYIRDYESFKRWVTDESSI